MKGQKQSKHKQQRTQKMQKNVDILNYTTYKSIPFESLNGMNTLFRTKTPCVYMHDNALKLLSLINWNI